MNPVQQTSTISSPCYETIFICQSCSADTKNTENVGVVLQVDKGPVGLGTTLEVAKQKFLAQKPITKRQTTAHKKQVPTGHLTNIHNPLETKPNLHHIFFDKAPRSSNKIKHHQPPATSHPTLQGQPPRPRCFPIRPSQTFVHDDNHRQVDPVAWNDGFSTLK